MNHLLSLLIVLSLGLFVNTNSFDVVASDVDAEVLVADLNSSSDSNFKLNIDANSNSETDLMSGSYVQCNCALVTWALIGGNRDCRASNRGSSCGGGINAYCSGFGNC